MCQVLKNPADRQFRRRCQVIAGSSLVLYMACSQLSLRYPHGLLSLVLAGLAGAAFFTEFLSVAFLLVRTFDEFQRILLTRSFLWATVITMGFATIWGFVELHSHGTVPHLPILLMPVILVCVTVAAKLLIFRQYRSPAE
jgi:hypothetical protein